VEGRAAHDSLDQVRVTQVAKESVGECHTAKCGGLSTSALGQQRKSAEAPETSAFGGRAEVDFGRLEVC
jgi:hypothetical protein